MAVSRAEGYRKGIGKERAALNVFEDFMETVLEITDYRFVTDKDENWTRGDYQLPNGKYIEVKGQPIDPVRMTKNYVELGEITDKLHHTGGFRLLKELLGLPNLENKTVRNKAKNTTGVVGEPPHFSLSLHSLANGTSYAYVNSHLEIIYLYSATHLKKLIVESLNSGLPILQGAGNANQDSLGVLVDLPIAMWEKINGKWEYIGRKEEQIVIESMQ
jgi:hypothetical protein